MVDQRKPPTRWPSATEIEAHEQVHLGRAAWACLRSTPGEALAMFPSTGRKAPMVRAALAELINAGVKIGPEVPPIAEDPDTVYSNFVKHAPGGDVDVYLNRLIEKSPAVRLARAGVDQARHALDQAELDLRDTKIHAGRRVRQPPDRQSRQPCSGRAGADDIARSRTSGSTPTSRRPRSSAPNRPDGGDLRRRLSQRVYRGRISGFSAGTGASTALLPRKTPRATSSRWCSGCRSASTWSTATLPTLPSWSVCRLNRSSRSRNRRRTRSRARSSNCPHSNDRPRGAGPRSACDGLCRRRNGSIY